MYKYLYIYTYSHEKEKVTTYTVIRKRQCLHQNMGWLQLVASLKL